MTPNTLRSLYVHSKLTSGEAVTLEVMTTAQLRAKNRGNLLETLTTLYQPGP